MRDIKFRGRKSNGEWLYGDLVTTETTDGIPTKKQILPFDAVLFENTEEVEKDTIGQFTGLLDKYGKEIYEGDIIVEKLKGKRKDGDFLKIVFGGFKWRGENKHGSTTSLSLLNEFHDIKVIGNIHDNPELLNK